MHHTIQIPEPPRSAILWHALPPFTQSERRSEVLAHAIGAALKRRAHRRPQEAS